MNLYAQAVAAERAAKIARDMKDHEAGIDSLRQQLAACQAEKLRLRDAVEFYLAANDPSEFGCACDPSVGHLCGPCHAHKQQTPLRQALATPPGDLSALREVCARVILESNERDEALMTDIEQLRSGEWTPECLK